MYDVIVIGSGPAGYVSAIKAAQAGFNTAIIEKDSIGGTCLNRGCIPTKAYLHSSQLYADMQNSSALGVSGDNVTVDYQQIYAHKEEVVEKLVSGIKTLLESNGIHVIKGKAKIESSSIVKVEDQKIEGKHIIVATGSAPSSLPIEGIDLEGVLNSDQILNIKKLPESLVIIGGGVIGSEFASFYSQLGTKVTILEALPNIISTLDREAGQNLKMNFKKTAVEVHTNAMVKKITKGDDLTVHYEEKGKEKEVTAEIVLCAVGRKSSIDDLFDQSLDIDIERGKILVDDEYNTSIKGIYAIGDVIKGPMLAHKASAEGTALIEILSGKKPSKDLSYIPSGIYTFPEIAEVGMTEELAKEQGIDFVTGKYITTNNSRNLIEGGGRGFIKVVAEKESQKILGATFYCPRATDMIGEVTTALTKGLTAKDLLIGVRSHPTFNEGLAEALEIIVEGNATHMAPKKKRS